MAESQTKSAVNGLTSQLPLSRLKEEAQGFGQALTNQGLSKASKGVESLTGRLSDFAEGKSTATKTAANVAQGDSPLKAGVKATASKVKDTVKDKLGFGGGGGGKIKVTNILESVDVPVSREVAYEQWTQFEDFPTFMKKVENVKQEEDEKLTWKAQIFWSHRSWNAEIVDQVPNERIVWKSDGEKGHVDGAITFHELAPELTRVLMILEYHPKGFFEHTGNLWRAQGRRARLELKHFARYVSTQTMLHQDELDGWKGEIHEGEVEKSDEQAKKERSQESSGTAKKSSSKRAAKKSTAKETPEKEAPAKKSAAKKAPAKKSAAKKAPAKKTAAAKAPAKKTAAQKAPAKRTAAAKKSTGKTTATKQATSKRSASKSTASKRSTAKKAPAKKATAKKAPAKKTSAKKTSARRTSKSTAR